MMNLFDILSLRTEYESIVGNSFELKSKESDINSLQAFIQEGHKTNSFRSGYDRAMNIAETLLREETNVKDARKGINI